MNHALIITGANITYPVGYSGRDMPVRGTGAHRIASHLRETRDWDVEVLDFIDAWSDEELSDFVDSRVTRNTKWIGFSVFFTYAIHYTPPLVVKHNRLIKYIKKKYPWIKIVVGSNKLVNVIRHENVDYFSVGNGEHAIVALCDYFVGNASEPKVKEMTNPFNLIDMTNKKFKIIDCFKDYPAFPHKNPRTSYEERDFIQKNEVLTIELSRGCMFKCTFCDYAPLGVKGDHTRDAINFEEELRENYDKWGVTRYVLTDETCNDRSEKIEKFANVVKTLPFQPQFHGFVRGDLFVKRARKDWDNMITMGFTSHSMGLESFNHASAKSIGKGMSPLIIQEGLIAGEEYFRKNVLSGNHYNGTLSMIAGLPHETFETLDNTADWLNKYWKNQVTMHGLYISQHVGHDGIDAVSEIEKNPSKYGYTWRDKTPIDRIVESYYYTNWEVKRIIPDNVSIHDMMNNKLVDWLKQEELKDRAKETMQRTWVHPSGDYDFIDMVEWSAKFQSDRIQKLKRPESLSGWHMHWYSILGYNLNDVYSGNPPIIDDNDVSRYYDFIENYKKSKINWYK